MKQKKKKQEFPFTFYIKQYGIFFVDSRAQALRRIVEWIEAKNHDLPDWVISAKFGNIGMSYYFRISCAQRMPPEIFFIAFLSLHILMLSWRNYQMKTQMKKTVLRKMMQGQWST
jgi:hypothetical protein